MPIKRFLLTACLLAGVSGASAQIEKVDPTAELRREGTFLDTTALALASPVELESWLKAHSQKPYYAFTEDRSREIRRDDALPLSWLGRDEASRTRFRGEAQPGETYLFQIGVYAANDVVKNLALDFGPLTREPGEAIPAKAFTCYNLGGRDLNGQHFYKRADVAQGSLQALWIGIEVPLSAEGFYEGTITLRGENVPETVFEIGLEVSGEPLADHGVGDAWRKSRIRWIDSPVGRSEEPTAPYIPLEHHGKTLRYLGGELSLTDEGLPSTITTHYDLSGKLDPMRKDAILAAPVRFVVETARGEEAFENSLAFTGGSAARRSWASARRNDRFEIACRGQMYFDGSIHYKITLKALEATEVSDIRLEIPYTDYASKYLMGLGQKGGARPSETLRWSWDTTRQQDQLWMGNVNAGMNLRLKDSNYVRPLVNIYYNFGRLRYPASWGNAGRGGVTVTPSGGQTLVSAFSGARRLEAGETLHYDFELIITPVKPIDLQRHLSTRFYHLNADTSAGFIPTALRYGANHINVHHKTDLYPFLNYPMADETAPDLKNFIGEAHAKGIKVSPYYTLRETTVKTPEFWILRSMGDEMIFRGPGNDSRTLIHTEGPKPWLVENLRTNYLPGWYAAFEQGRFKGQLDIAVIATPESRWSNYFLEGLDWMVKKLDIDGIYIDDSSLDPETMRRARRILDQGRHRTVDMHTWNHMNEHAGWANSLQLYTGLLPYVDRLWIGELFKADNPRDFWLVEMSGIPFGLMSETLDAHNIFRGLAFGMLPRLPWSGNPAPEWKLFDDFGMNKAQMYGYWDERAGAATDNEQVSATVYRRNGAALVALTNWDNDGEQTLRLSLEPAKLGFSPRRAWAPEVEELQEASEITLKKNTITLTLPAAGGRVIWIE